MKKATRNTKIMGFSVPKEVQQKFEKLARKKHKTKSEFFREVLDAYFVVSEMRNINDSLDFDDKDVARALQAYWNYKKSHARKLLVIALGIIEKDGKVLIGRRAQKDKYVKQLNWAFPGGTVESLDFESELIREIKEETSLSVSVENLITARIHPDAGVKDIQIITLYFYCKLKPGSKHKKARSTQTSSDKFKEFKWVQPAEVFKYFSTSVSDDVTRFLMMLQAKNQ